MTDSISRWMPEMKPIGDVQQESQREVMTPTKQVSIVMDKYVEACSKIKELEAQNAGLREREASIFVSYEKVLQLCKQLDRKRFGDEELEVMTKEFIKKLYRSCTLVGDAIDECE